MRFQIKRVIAYKGDRCKISYFTHPEQLYNTVSSLQLTHGKLQGRPMKRKRAGRRTLQRKRGAKLRRVLLTGPRMLFFSGEGEDRVEKKKKPLCFTCTQYRNG
jgi:hypothetical protein